MTVLIASTCCLQMMRKQCVFGNQWIPCKRLPCPLRHKHVGDSAIFTMNQGNFECLSQMGQMSQMSQMVHRERLGWYTCRGLTVFAKWTASYALFSGDHLRALSAGPYEVRLAMCAQYFLSYSLHQLNWFSCIFSSDLCQIWQVCINLKKFGTHTQWHPIFRMW